MLYLITISIRQKLPPTSQGMDFFLLFFYTTVKLIMVFGVGVYEKGTEGGS